jgi:hypothetical protein
MIQSKLWRRRDELAVPKSLLLMIHELVEEVREESLLEWSTMTCWVELLYVLRAGEYVHESTRKREQNFAATSMSGCVCL